MVLWIPLLIFNDNDNSTASATAERLFETLRVYGSSTITTTATSTATTTATAKTGSLFEALRVYCLVILSTDRGLVVLRFCEGAEELSTREVLRVINVGVLAVGGFIIARSCPTFIWVILQRRMLFL